MTWADGCGWDSPLNRADYLDGGFTARPLKNV